MSTAAAVDGRLSARWQERSATTSMASAGANAFAPHATETFGLRNSMMQLLSQLVA
jgi:hypothetical protein